MMMVSVLEAHLNERSKVPQHGESEIYDDEFSIAAASQSRKCAAAAMSLCGVSLICDCTQEAYWVLS